MRLGNRLAASTVALTAAVHAITTNFTSSVNPNHITLPSIPQLTSYNVNTECTYYNPNVPIVAKDWPTSWSVATSNGMSKSAEFTKLYNSIKWSSAPTSAVRKADAGGALDFSGYDMNKDPDCWWSATTCVTPKHPGVLADIYRCPEPDTWGLTFDDGPNCSHNAFYDFLQHNNQKASMFYIGSNVMDWPYGAQRGIKDGHHVAVHTWSHPLMTTLTNQEVLAELYYTLKMIKLVTGVTPRYWRAPFGDQDDRVRWIATQLGLTSIVWNLDTNDWAAGDGETLAQVQQAYDDYIKMGTNGTFKTGGNIVLTHEIDNTTMSLMVKNYGKIKKAYKHVVDVATCMNITHPYVESTPTHKTFASLLAASAPSSNASSAVSTDGSNVAVTTGNDTAPSVLASASAQSSTSLAAKTFDNNLTLLVTFISFIVTMAVSV
ncbi:hypothetical protein NQZ79_g2457 [Umbelopsis isabellina]|nr:hypothetical protein NQZ79_g2457 [Umbelopsis isabellina]